MKRRMKIWHLETKTTRMTPTMPSPRLKPSRVAAPRHSKKKGSTGTHADLGRRYAQHDEKRVARKRYLSSFTVCHHREEAHAGTFHLRCDRHECLLDRIRSAARHHRSSVLTVTAHQVAIAIVQKQKGAAVCFSRTQPLSSLVYSPQLQSESLSLLATR